MLAIVNDLVTMVYDLAGDYGLAFFLAIVVINTYYVYWYIPKRTQASAVIEPAEARRRIINLKIYFGFPNLFFGIFTTAIVITQGPAMWVKGFAGFISLTMVLCVLIATRLFISTRF